jgi:hypothetical protein
VLILKELTLHKIVQLSATAKKEKPHPEGVSYSRGTDAGPRVMD